MAFFHLLSRANWNINFQNRNYKSTTNEAVKLTARDSMKIKIRRVVVGTIHSVNFGFARENPFSLSVPEELPGFRLRSEINLARSFAIHVYLQEYGDKRTGKRGRSRVFEIWNMKASTTGKFVRFLSFCNGR